MKILTIVRNIPYDASMFLCSLSFFFTSRKIAAKDVFNDDDPEDIQHALVCQQIGIACQITICMIDMFLSSKKAVLSCRTIPHNNLQEGKDLPLLEETRRARGLPLNSPSLLIDFLKILLVTSEAGIIYSSELDEGVAMKLAFLTLIQLGEMVAIPIKYCYENHDEDESVDRPRIIMSGCSTICLLTASIYAGKEGQHGNAAIAAVYSVSFNAASIASDLIIAKNALC